MVSSSPPDLDWHCAVSGKGTTPLVCVHGWGCEGGQFEKLAQMLETDFRIHRPDLPGHGETPLGTFAPGFAAYSAALAEWIIRHGLEHPILLGHSMGGVLSLMAAKRIGARAVINLDGSLPAARSTLEGQATIRGWLGQPDFPIRLADSLRAHFFLPHERDEEMEKIIHRMCSAPEPVLRFLPETINTLRPEDILAEVGVPVLYVGADKPRFDPVAAQALLPQLAMDRIPGTGHFLHMRAPGQVARLVREFLAGQSHIEAGVISK